MWHIIGHDRAVSLLGQSLATGRLSHAYLFTGPEHIGKTTLARELAAALNCTGAEAPCGECSACRKIAAGNHADVQVIGLGQSDNGAESKVITIEQIKDMQHDASLPPFEGKHKVFIIEQAELLSIEAANCLLKTLEEPSPNVTFILLTENERLLPETVVSRCLRLELLPGPADVIAAALQERGCDAERAALLARLCHGRPGWAVGAAADEDILAARRDDVGLLLGLMIAPCEERFAWAGQVASKFTQNRRAVYGMLETWRDYWRDLMLVKLGRRDMITHIDREAELAETAAAYRLEQIRDFVNRIEDAGQHLRRNVNPRLALEVLMIDIPSAQGGETARPPAGTSVTYG